MNGVRPVVSQWSHLPKLFLTITLSIVDDSESFLSVSNTSVHNGHRKSMVSNNPLNLKVLVDSCDTFYHDEIES